MTWDSVVIAHNPAHDLFSFGNFCAMWGLWVVAIPRNGALRQWFIVTTIRGDFKDTTESNTSASYLDLLLSIESDGQLRTSLYDKRDDFDFHITNFPFMSSYIPSSPAYGVFISQLIRYARACSSYECFILRAVRLSSKLLGQGYVMERWNRPSESFMVDMGISSNIMNIKRDFY